MNHFVQRYADQVEWILSGFDRLVFRGYLRGLSHPNGVLGFLQVRGLWLKDFGSWVQRASERLKEASLRAAHRQGRPVIYLASSRTDKEATARQVAERDRIRNGLVCVLTCVESCMSFEVYRNRDAKRLELVPRIRKCLFLYHYWMDPILGFVNARIQSWLPFSIQVCVNGREWLARQMDRKGLAYERVDNCIVQMADPARAQRMADRQVRFRWQQVLDGIARRLNPAHREILGDYRGTYYWSVYQSEWASDIRFRNAAFLARIYRPMVVHGITHFSSGDVIRFLGKRPQVNTADRVVSDFKQRPEGVRIKHWVGWNSVKLYNKHPNILRPESTINKAAAFRVFRRKEGDRRGKRTWRQLRQGIADLSRRAQVSHAINERYLNALAAADTTVPLGDLIGSLCHPVIWNGRRFRGLRPWAPEDIGLFEAVCRGEFCVHGFRNRDLQPLLFEKPAASPEDRRRRGGQICRRLRLLRAHGVICKIPRTMRYQLTEKGRGILAAVLTAKRVTQEQLNAIAS